MEATLLSAGQYQVSGPLGPLTIKAASEAQAIASYPATLRPELSASERQESALKERASQISAECRRRIYAVASNEAQMNMAAASALISSKTSSARSEEEKAVLAGLEAALGWVNAMRANVQTLANDPAANFMDNGQWPAPPDIATTIIAQF